MKPILFVEVLAVASNTVTNTAIGLSAGNFQWVSSPSTTANWKTGIIDQTSVKGVARAMNTAQGGGLGGFVGDVEITATASALVSAFTARDISLIGKIVRIYVSLTADFADAYLRYTGKISAPSTLDEITVQIVCKNSLAYDAKKIKSVTVTEEMALNISENEAVDKSVIPVFGNICDFPIIRIPPESDLMPILNHIDVGFTVFQGDAPRLDAVADWYNQITTKSGSEYKGKSLLQILSVYQQTADETYLWIALSFNGSQPLFGAGAESWIDEIKRTYLNEYLKIVRGSGSGNRYRVIDVKWDTQNSIETIWMQIDTTVPTDLTAAIAGSNAVAPLHLPETGWGPDARMEDPGFIASVDGNIMSSNVSYLSLLSSSNIYIVHKSATLAGAFVAWKTNAGTVDQRSADNIVDLIYETDNWKAIRINTEFGISSDEDSFQYSDLYDLGVKYRERSTVVDYAFNENFIGGEEGATYHTSDPVTNGQSVAGETTSQNSGLNVAIAPNYTRCTSYCHIEDLFQGIDICGDVQTALIPKVDMSFSWGSSGAGSPYEDQPVDCEIQICGIGEGNTVLGVVKWQKQIPFINQPYGNPGDFSISIDPQNKVVNLTNAYGYPDASTELYSDILKTLDVSDMIKMDSCKQLRYFHIAILFRLPLQSTDYYDATISRTFHGVYAAITRTVPKDNLFLRTVAEATTYSPALLAKEVATKNGITCYSPSFTNANFEQRKLFSTSISEFNGYYAPASGEMVSDVLSAIAQKSLLALYQDTANVLHAKWLRDTDESVFSFEGDDVVKGTLEVSKPNGGYQYTSYSFKVARNLISDSTNLEINTDSELDYFPAETEYEPQGDLITAGITRSGFKRFTPEGGSETVVVLLRVTFDTLDKAVLFPFVRGTRWRLVSNTGLAMLCRLDAIAPDPIPGTGNVGIRLGFIAEDYPAGITAFLTSSLQLYGPSPKWRELVSGSFVTDYAEAASMWQSAQDALIDLGSEQAMSSTYTTLNQPIWGSDAEALTGWASNVIKYGAMSKTVITFRTNATAENLALTLMEYGSFAWGPFFANPVSGRIVELEDDYSLGEIAVTMLVLDTPPSQNYIQDIPLSEDPENFIQDIPLSEDPDNFIQNIPLQQ